MPKECLNSTELLTKNIGKMEWDNLHELLRSLYDDMMPLAGDMAAVAKGLAGLGALFYVALKVWQALSRAEPIDMFPLLRPFALGFALCSSRPSFGNHQCGIKPGGCRNPPNTRRPGA
jgi:hypothetical protein